MKLLSQLITAPLILIGVLFLLAANACFATSETIWEILK